MDSNRIPENSQLDEELIAYYQAQEWRADLIHGFIFSQMMQLGNAAIFTPVDDFNAAYNNGKRVTGKFPKSSTEHYLNRESSPGNTEGFAMYDDLGDAIFRVDLEGPAHNGVNPPHIHMADWNFNAADGVRYLNGWDAVDVKPYESFSELFILLFGGN